MKAVKELSCLLLALALLFWGVTSAQAINYPGNSNSGFGGALGQGTLQIEQFGSTLDFTLNKGAGNLDNFIVLYIDSVSGGYSGTGTFMDSADSSRIAASGYDGTNRAILNFPAGTFTADYAIVYDTVNGAVLFQLNNTSHTLLGSLGGAGASATDSQFLFSCNLSNLGIVMGDAFDFVATYLTVNASRSDEAIGDGIPSGNPGTATATFTTAGNYASIIDSDGDGVADSVDVCPLGDDNVDFDNDGIPDVCDYCRYDLPIRLNGADYLPGLQDVYDNDMADLDTVLAQGWFVDGALLLNRAISVSIQGGRTCDFSGDEGVATAIESLTIGELSGAVAIVGKLSIGWHGY